MIVLFTGSLSVSYAQLTEENIREIALNGTEQQIVTECSSLTQQGFLYLASILADKLITFDPQSSNYAYRKGFLELEVNMNYEDAMRYFEIAILDIDPNYDMYSIKEKSAPPDALFHLARCHHLAENIDKAEEYFNQFKAVTNKKSELIPVADLKLIQCTQAREHIANPVDVYLKNMV